MRSEKSIERESKEIRPLFVRTTDEDGLLVDITAAPVWATFAREKHRPTGWKVAAWVVGGPFETPIGEAWEADVEVGGPGTGADIELAPGRWFAFVKVDTGDEVAVIAAGTLTVH